MTQNVKMFCISAHTLQQGKLKVPIEFVHMYGEMCLSGRSVLLMAPNGDTWPVGLEKLADASVMFGDGWTEFVQHYSISDLYIIMFRYKCHQESVPVFDIFIFKDSNNIEITYPRKPISPIKAEEVVEDECGKNLLCCFVVANERNYEIFAVDLCETRIRGEGNSVLKAGDLSKVAWIGDDQFSRYNPPLPDPVLRLPKCDDAYIFPDGMAFGILDGKLYMVGGSCTRNTSSIDDNLNVYVIDTNDIISSPPPLDHRMHVTNGPALSAPKPDPLVIPLAGQLFVFNRTLDPYIYDAKGLIEVLDPESKSWSSIPLPPELIEWSEKLPPNEDCIMGILAHGTRDSSIVLCLAMDRSKNDFFVLDAKTKTWTQHLNNEQYMPPFYGDCLFWDGIWFRGTSQNGLLILRQGEGEDREDVILDLSKEQVVHMDGKVLWVDDSPTLLVFSRGVTSFKSPPDRPDYFRVDMMRVDKGKSDNSEGDGKITGNVVKSMLFRFNNFNRDLFNFHFCFYLIKK